MTHHDPGAVLLALPRRSWEALTSSPDPAVHRALDSLVQVDTCVFAAVRSVGGVVDDLFVSVHQDAAEATAGRWLVELDGPHDGDVTVMSVPVGLDRPREATA